MSRFDPEKLSVRFVEPCHPKGPVVPRRYTLTHSDLTGSLYLTIGPDFDRYRISGPYTRLMRDEVLGEWALEGSDATLHVRVHVSGGLVIGTAGQRYRIFKMEMPLALSAIRHGDKILYEEHPMLESSKILVHFSSSKGRYDKTEDYGTPSSFR